MVVDDRCWVFWAPVVGVPGPWPSLLDPAEHERAAGFLFDDDRDRFVGGHVLARHVAGALGGIGSPDVVLDFSCSRCGRPHGRPVVVVPDADLHVSISHAGRWVAVAAAHGAAVGVDIEATNRRPGDWFDRVLSERERAELGGARPTATDAITYWTRKEAVLKLAGVGLMTDPAEVCVTPPGTPPRLRRCPPRLGLGPDVALDALDGPAGIVASLAVARGGRPVEQVRLPADPSTWSSSIRQAVQTSAARRPKP